MTFDSKISIRGFHAFLLSKKMQALEKNHKHFFQTLWQNSVFFNEVESIFDISFFGSFHIVIDNLSPLIMVNFLKNWSHMFRQLCLASVLHLQVKRNRCFKVYVLLFPLDGKSHFFQDSGMLRDSEVLAFGGFKNELWDSGGV